MSHLEIIVNKEGSEIEKSAIADYLTLASWNKEAQNNKKDAEAWEALWQYFCSADNKGSIAFYVISKVGNS